MKIKKKLKEWKEYSKMSDLGIIARRKFFNNAFDGALTCSGIVSGIFILFIAGAYDFSPKDILITGFATALAIGISGLWGAFLSEEAERKKKVLDMKKDMAEVDEENEQMEFIHIKNKYKKGNKKKPTTLLEKAEKFATIVASLVDGGAPVLGSSLPLIPFFFGGTLKLEHFIFSYIILSGLLIYLGIFLGQISGGGRLRYAIHLITAGIVTLIVSILLGI
ncbi:MAG: VIT1/CCC1 transporter family protein [Promethearchaeota archaeon]|nr:MAG: VIT1/CCC1 transporter family protein [Candidatus Lokiarchaeota archaeon]